MKFPRSASANTRVLRTLKDGYWDRTEVIALPDGTCRVRKQTKGTAARGPWGVRSLQREILFLTSLPERARPAFPPVLAAWNDASDAALDVGYEMPYYPDHTDAGALARHATLTQDLVDEFQDALADAVLQRLHEPVPAEESFAAHVVSVIQQAWSALEIDPSLTKFLNADTIELNGTSMPGPRAAFARIRHHPGILPALDAAPCVRLHGDLFLENILWRTTTAGDSPRLVLIDPVSVAGVMRGPPVFDLVKYVSYATGELLALRSERVAAHIENAAPFRCHFHILWEDPALQPFHTLDWHSRFHRAFAARHGTADHRLYQLIDAYFSAAMAVNTTGLQRLARLLKATAGFNAVLTAD